jgi:5-methylcytosine-specific restriction endonuclease McrA
MTFVWYNSSMPYKYTDEQIIEALKDSPSVAETCRRLGMRSTGSSHRALSKRIERLGRPKPTGFDPGATLRKTADHFLVVKSEGSNRTDAYLLVRSLIEIGRPYECHFCHISDWFGDPLTLQVDHEDGNGLNNQPDNLRFLCPNCHSQTPNFGNRSPR